jgi:hypothetical protein
LAVSAAKQVLVVGFDPNSVDFSTPERVAAHLTADTVLAGIAAETTAFGRSATRSSAATSPPIPKCKSCVIV